MATIDLIQTGAMVVMVIGTVAIGIWFGLRQKELEKRWEALARHREELYAQLADPARIETDFEKSARAREMRDAQRTTLPREGAGPPAKVHRPKMRGAKPGNWRINRP